jgi:GNAT superfamily N-acetyltransferase
MGAAEFTVSAVGEGDLADLLPLMEAYCAFYEAAPGRDALEALARALLDDPEHEGTQVIARDADGRAVGFATLYWTWSTSQARRLAIMNDLFVTPDARGTGVAELLMRVCAKRSRAQGASVMEWATAPDNHRAQALYDRFGGVRESWVTYALELDVDAPPSSSRQPE